MNGWQRIGIVLSVVWCFAIAGYAAYERSLLPIKVFGEETKNPGESWIIARGLLFIDIYSDSRDMPGVLAAASRVRNATTEAERQAARVELNWAGTRVFKTRFKDIFWRSLYVPIGAFWVLSYLIVFGYKWVIAGFVQKKD